MFSLVQVKWTNKQRVLVFAARGITHRDRHLMTDLQDFMPHSKTESKFERKDPLYVINEVGFKNLISSPVMPSNPFFQIDC